MSAQLPNFMAQSHQSHNGMTGRSKPRRRPSETATLIRFVLIYEIVPIAIGGSLGLLTFELIKVAAKAVLGWA